MTGCVSKYVCAVHEPRQGRNQAGNYHENAGVQVKGGVGRVGGWEGGGGEGPQVFSSPRKDKRTCSHADEDTSWDASSPFPDVEPKLEDLRVSPRPARLRALSLRSCLNFDVSLRKAMI